MNPATEIIAAGYDPRVLQAEPASSQAVLQAANHLYNAALSLRTAPQLTANDIATYLTPALLRVLDHVKNHETRRKIAAVEKAAPSIIQNGPDKTADFLRAVNRDGADVSFK